MERVEGESPEVVLEMERPAAPAPFGAGSDPDLASTGATRLAPARPLLAEGSARTFSEAAEENRPIALAWEGCCCPNQHQRLSLREAELLRLEEDLKLRADELDRKSVV